MTARKTGAAEIPLLVQLSRGDVVKRTSQELHVILENLSADPELAPHTAEVLERLLVTMGQLVVRFAQYMKYTARVVLLSFHRQSTRADSVADEATWSYSCSGALPAVQVGRLRASA